jgi:demethylmenaquinone methyltransferase/2-methoxy-6-polyprenyl-1,4-benzoquinol methylase
MFGRIAGRYDLLNHLLSFNLDRWWRARTVRSLMEVLERPEARVLDLCCGTGDLLIGLGRRGRAWVGGADFSHPMLLEARRKLSRRGIDSPLFEADALQLPLPSDSLDAITVGFGFRNLANYASGLAEIHRVLKRGGVAAILEFSQPPNRPFAVVHGYFTNRILPRVGGLISGSPDAYKYLPESIQKFPDAEGLSAAMRGAGYSSVEFIRMTGGAVALHLGRK